MPEILKVLLILPCFIVMTASEGIMCYKCTPTKEFNSQRSLGCSQFDRSQRFKVYCPKSTFCMNKTYSVPLLHGEIEIIERDCAPQKEVSYYWNDSKWNSEERVVSSAYNERCSMFEDTGRPGKPAEFRYCGSDSCNA
ncbi:uncharacterized protein LOC124177894 [Neodiprion fabricii]|uniref:uncharacterized protein LOC124177894 n=1 Tax=Neodiprion fabricii TaxID=2872261 RepID=UPI001ED8ECF4|nr:uncharacterized protein LOC124177894 [Neodiprion fabricii]